MKFDFIVTDVVGVRLTDEKKYPNKFVEYKADLISNEIIYRPNGYSTVCFNGKTLETAPGTIYVLPHMNGQKYTVTFTEPDYFIDIFFRSDVPIADEPFILNVQNNSKFQSLFHRAFSCWVTRDNGYKHESISVLYKILAELQKQNYIPENKFRKIEPALRYIDENLLKESISCEMLADMCQISYSYLQRLFTEKFGLPPKKYIIQLKINYACDLLASGMHSVTQAARLAGFDNLYFFSRQFKEYVGMSPRAYQQNKPK